MPGSSLSVSGPNFILNTAVAESLKQFADILEGKDDFSSAVDELLRDTLKTHRRIIFNGDNYSEEWVREAERRGLLNLASVPDALPHFISEKNIRLFESHGILTADEVMSRYEIALENYAKVINIEAMTMLEMARRDILPAVCKYIKLLSDEAAGKKQICATASCTMEEKLINLLSENVSALFDAAEALDEYIHTARTIDDALETARYYRDTVMAQMDKLRDIADNMETYTAKEYWPFPTYGDLLFSIQE